MVLIFILVFSFFSNANADCGLSVNDLQELRTTLLCSCDDDTSSCAIMVDAFQNPNGETLSAAIGAAIGTHLNYRSSSPYQPKGRLSQAGLNDWAATAFKGCDLLEPDMRKLLSLSIDDQIAAMNSDSKLCNSTKKIFEDFEEPHFTARCENGSLKASPKKQKDSVEHTVIRAPASTNFTHILRSRGGETAKDTIRPFEMVIRGKSDSINYKLNFMGEDNKPLKPSVAEVKEVRGLWQRHRREFVEMTNCCQKKFADGKACKKYDIEN
ncbi:MAG: hypothetical protein A4S09_02700 [Proteobacteria bacterium SG_bin7]|nr:MAG: hypothetical protein A4S09_02700 [Proteobacteria bacterium SG_bin7]